MNKGLAYNITVLLYIFFVVIPVTLAVGMAFLWIPMLAYNSGSMSGIDAVSFSIGIILFRFLFDFSDWCGSSI